ncbi:DUF397 domain-containing protein [Streptomyces sp. NBRC 110028]|uniref:DUF397 domain-containing protein n=1 Tax=Streptomyces sp. NBRC 110028 TaxID=1621260 RepID=UPI00099ED225|nr:DUF397 domain-containing protein [Streptomyces sp. NBRC 110028]
MSGTELDWFKSSYSGSGGGNCVEVAMCLDTVHVRDSKDTRLGSLTVSRQAWSAFTTELDWFKSSYSGGGGGDCVEVAIRPDTVHVRDSKDTQLGRLTVSPTAWAAFTAQL